jgi:hypothetical protein
MSILPPGSRARSDGDPSVTDVPVEGFSEIMKSAIGKSTEQKLEKGLDIKEPQSAMSVDHAPSNLETATNEQMIPIPPNLPTPTMLQPEQNHLVEQAHGTGTATIVTNDLATGYQLPLAVVKNVGLIKDSSGIKVSGRKAAPVAKPDEAHTEMISTNGSQTGEGTVQTVLPVVKADGSGKESQKDGSVTTGSAEEAVVKGDAKSIISSAMKVETSAPMACPIIAKEEPAGSTNSNDLERPEVGGALAAGLLSVGPIPIEAEANSVVSAPVAGKTPFAPATTDMAKTTSSGAVVKGVSNTASKQRDPIATNSVDSDTKSQSHSQSGGIPPDNSGTVQDQGMVVPQMISVGHAGLQGGHPQTGEMMPSVSQAGSAPTPTSEHVSQGAARPGTAIDVPATLPTINTARVIQSMGQTEMRVGMSSAEFGNISVRASSNHESIIAQISLDHDGLAKELATHLPEIQEKLGSVLPAVVRIDLTGALAGDGSGRSGGMSNQTPSDSGAKERQETGKVGNAPDNNARGWQVEHAVAGPVAAGSYLSARLDIRV